LATAIGIIDVSGFGNAGIAMTKFFDTAIGKSMLSDASQAGYAKLQHATTLGNGFVAKVEAAVEMDHGEPCAMTLRMPIRRLKFSTKP
jgi:hypothetical protein